MRTKDAANYKRWLVIAPGKNAEHIIPTFEGAQDFANPVSHAFEYKSGKALHGKRVLVVGCRSFCMWVCLDHRALSSMVIRNAVHDLQLEVLDVALFSTSLCTHLVHGRALKTMLPRVLRSSEEGKMDSLDLFRSLVAVPLLVPTSLAMEHYTFGVGENLAEEEPGSPTPTSPTSSSSPTCRSTSVCGHHSPYRCGCHEGSTKTCSS